MRHAQGFTRSHWMPPPGEYWRHITPAAAMVIDVADGHKTQLLASTYHTKQWPDQLDFFANQRMIETRTISMTYAPYFM